MRSVVAVVSAVAMILAQMPPGFAQNAVSAQPATYNPALDATVSVHTNIADAFKAFPKAGDPLIKRIADIIVKNPRHAAGLVKYVQTAPGLSNDQKLAAERGLAEALKRLGVNAADMEPPVYKAAPAQVYDYSWILGLLAILAIACIPLCQGQGEHD
jgi:hypothetical protein